MIRALMWPSNAEEMPVSIIQTRPPKRLKNSRATGLP